MKNQQKIVLSKDIQKKIILFFSKTSIPRMLDNNK